MQDDRPGSDPRPSQNPTVDSPQSHRAPERIGPYTLLEKRGEGGMGIVYLAEQTEPMRRRVALKIIKEGLDSKAVLARFDAERQALALMDHPAIARIYDAGMTGQGRPYFAMEFVQGIPITDYCDRNSLSNRARIELFLQVCAGVQHAHQKAVIHRDLKPTNVLVALEDGRAVVKIIDFGIAKALARPLTDMTLHTELGVMLGTPEYMSPEQADLTGLDVDTRSDVYSLGVMLYELLVGALPFEARALRDAGFDEIRRKVREVDPPRPSARVSSLGPKSGDSARRRSTEPRALRRELLGDLDWITMRALEKDRARRYASPSDLADDLRRYLKFEPVLARAPSARYRTMKFVRRHRLGVAAAVVMVLSAAAGTAMSVVGLVRARRAETQARTEAATKGQVADFLKNLFKVSDPYHSEGGKVTARELLDKAAVTIDTDLSAQPLTQAEMSGIMGEVYANLGLYPQAEALYGKALAIRTRVQGPEHPDTLNAMMNLATSYLHQSRYPEAERLAAQSLEIKKRVMGPEHPDTARSMMNLANVYLRQGRYPEAERLYLQTLEIFKRVLGPEDPRTLDCMHNLADVYSSEGRTAEAERLLLQTIEAEKRTLGPSNPEILKSMSNLAKVYQEEGRLADAERLESEAIAGMRRVLAPDHRDLLYSLTNLVLIYQGEGRYADAERLQAEVLAIQKRALGPEHADVLWSMNNLALAYQSQGRYEEAEKLHTETLAIRKRVLGPTHPDTLVSMYNLACVAAKRGHRSQAMDWLRQDVEGGDPDFESMAGDAELQSLHGPEFDVLLAQVRRNAAAARDSQSGSAK